MRIRDDYVSMRVQPPEAAQKRRENTMSKKLEEYCQVSGLSKTAVVEKAVERYVDENLETMKEIAEGK